MLMLHTRIRAQASYWLGLLFAFIFVAMREWSVIRATVSLNIFPPGGFLPLKYLSCASSLRDPCPVILSR
jgi:hypothetical protein